MRFSGFRCILAVALAGCAAPEPRDPAETTEILWDTWGVPHIFAASEEDVFRAFGAAQMASHGDLILRLYGAARGRAAEYWGEEQLDSDRWVRRMGVYERAREWYEAQSESFRRDLDAFAEGMNAYAAEHGDRLADDVEVVLPVDAVDVLAHAQRAVHFTFIAGPEVVDRAKASLPRGSNTWAIGPSRSASGRAMLLQNPHLPWSDLYLFYEAQLVGPGIDAYGTTLVGVPVLAIAFNDHLGWSHTVNTIDAADVYELSLADGGYRFDGEVKELETETETLKVRQPDGSLRDEALTVKRSVHGPVVYEEGDRALALRVAGLDAPGMLEQWWDMGRATSLDEFERALARLQVPMFNVMYADRDGHILYVFNGRVPKRSRGDWAYWAGVVPGDTSETLWTETLPYEELPRVLDPQTGWLQNANDPPWTSTYPEALDPADYPPYMAPELMHFRAERSASMLAEDASITFDELVQDKHSTHMLLADRLLDDLLPAARARGGRAAGAAAVLEAWDRAADAESRGGVLFLAWAARYASDPTHFATPWRLDDPLETPDGLADPDGAVDALEVASRDVEERHGAMDVAWGDVYRIRYGGRDLPANGGPGDPPGIFRVAYFAPPDAPHPAVVAGDTYYAAIEFGDTVRARVLTAYGNATQPGSPHLGDQLELFAQKQMRPVWRVRGEIEEHLELREALEHR